MSALLSVAADEWRHWRRSRLVLLSAGLFFALLAATTALSALELGAAQQSREQSQAAAEQAFLSQPDRHPHRMVHYGHYAFRAPAPLAFLDPGLDSVVGQSIFLEGHRQNSASFADVAASANLGGLAWLTPAIVFQLFGALLLIVVGHTAVVRERESATLSTILLHGVSGGRLLAGKTLALVGLTLLMVAPMFVLAWWGESLSVALAMALIYFLYLNVWAGGVVLLSSQVTQRSLVLVVATTAWLAACLLVPSLAVDSVARGADDAGKIESDLNMLEAMREVGDGHNAADPAFAALRANLLVEYDVDDVADLPMNIRGVVATKAEADLTAVLNEYADARIANELAQVRALNRFAWLSPAMALAAASRATAGTDLTQYHRFLREAEALRFSFVQALNDLHAHELDYNDDINRSRNAAAERQSRISADNWALLDAFEFVPAPLADRLGHARASVTMLALWLLVIWIGLVIAGRRLSP